MYNHLLYLLYWAVNFLVILGLGQIFPADIVLGNYKFTAVEAAIYSGFWVTMLVWSIWDFVYVRGVKVDRVSGAFLFFFLFNSLAFWLVARFSHLVGLGISGFYWALVLGFTANILQRFVWRLLLDKKKA